jgi:O-antigen/teichoic acid export membrane protein
MTSAPNPIFPREEPAGNSTIESSRRRYKKIFEGAASAIVSKGAVLVVNAISLPIAVRYLGAVQFGIWATITTTLSLLLVLDLGIANTLTNLISEAYAREDRDLAGQYATTAFWLIMLVAAGLGLIGLLAWPFLRWDVVFHVDPASRGVVSRAVAVAYAVFLFGMPAGLAAKMLGGYQELRAANLFAAAGSVGSLFGVIATVHLHGGLESLVGVSSGAMIVSSGVCLLWLWTRHKPWLAPWPRNLSRSVSRRLMHSGSEFFVIQLAGLLAFNSDNLVIAHYAGPAEVTPYTVTWRLVSYAAALQTIMIPALWPAYAEAFVRGDLDWVRKTFRRVMILTMGVALACCIVFFFWGKALIKLWAGTDAMPTQALLGWMCVWFLISTFMNNVSCVLVAASETRVQAWSSIAGAVVNLGLSIWLAQRMGPAGVILGTIISYALVLIGPQVWKVTQILQGHGKNSVLTEAADEVL